jgi:DNA-binding PadR family transcriptional regulator
MMPEDNQVTYSHNGLSVDEIEKRIVKEFLDIIILCELKEHSELTGYDLALMEHEKFGISLSPGTVYATMYSMERRGLICGRPNAKKTTYVLTEKGGAALSGIGKSSERLVDFMKCIFSVFAKSPEGP